VVRTTRVKPAVAVCCGEPESVTWNPRRDPGNSLVGVPLITPVDGSSVAHAGSLPRLTLHVRAPVPPIAVSVCEYGTPTIPVLSARVVMVSGGVVTVIVVLAVALCGGVPESVTWNVSGVVTIGAVGLPLTTPVEAFNVRPAGSGPRVNCQA
jgi:hypothetical protein